ncbi:hypothetical protein L861_15325 [Litchfieldella anticariensis FP35 = DSM 16096]|uniref:Uncharacterized protein n=1 Tax=Litchfieldella anticariensis (strain DSM 16096 / CECT 5854 / CIP 108499 / LMG 22089 / FP35) TaxID=1121939 RepID=S2L1V9_LITA3|nr:hypothetical protein L861_15325 [Halomonas anticariensis FP35 = DSM 16096]
MDMLAISDEREFHTNTRRSVALEDTMNELITTQAFWLGRMWI